MRYIELQTDKVAVKIDDISAIVAIDATTTDVFVDDQRFKADIPYPLLKAMIESEPDSIQQDVNTSILSEMNESLMQLRQTNQFFGGDINTSILLEINESLMQLRQTNQFFGG